MQCGKKSCCIIKRAQLEVMADVITVKLKQFKNMVRSLPKDFEWHHNDLVYSKQWILDELARDMQYQYLHKTDMRFWNRLYQHITKEEINNA